MTNTRALEEKSGRSSRSENLEANRSDGCKYYGHSGSFLEKERSQIRMGSLGVEGPRSVLSRTDRLG